MMVRQIARAAAVLLQADDAVEMLDRYESVPTDKDASAFIDCVNLATAELAASFPVCKLKRINTQGTVALDEFDEAPIAIRSVTDRGLPVAFTVDSLGVHIGKKGTYDITYSVAPRPQTAVGPVEVGALVTAELVTYLTARNYCLMTGRTDEATIWDRRYEAEAEKRRLTRRATMPARRRTV